VKDIPISKKSNVLWIVLLKDLGGFALYFNKSDNCFGGFEVHKVRVKPSRSCKIKQKDGSVSCFTVPERRVIASSVEFGLYAWHYPCLDMVFDEYPMFLDFKHEIEKGLKFALNDIRKPRISKRE